MNLNITLPFTLKKSKFKAIQKYELIENIKNSNYLFFFIKPK